MATVVNTVTEGLGFTGSTVGEAVLLLVDTLGLDDPIAINQLHILIETLGIGDTLDNLLHAKEHVIEELGFSATYRFLWTILLQENLGFNDPLVATPSKYVKLVETLALSGYATTTIQAHNLILASLGLSDILVQAGLGELIVEGIGFTGNVDDIIRAYQKVAEEFSLSGTMVDNIAMVVSIEEHLGLSDTVLTNAHVVELLTDGINFTTSFTYDGDTYTGWVMNSENFAVTNYKQYNFTDLAKINGKYYGVQADGVYLLEGDTDEASYIKAVIRSGKMDFGTSSKKTLTQAYLGYRGNGDLVMKMTTDDSIEIFYTLANVETGLQTNRLRLAKGVVGRYWQFEIVTQNTTELELDTVEFFPIMFKRKV